MFWAMGNGYVNMVTFQGSSHLVCCSSAIDIHLDSFSFLLCASVIACQVSV